jgi:hypothetical protein
LGFRAIQVFQHLSSTLVTLHGWWHLRAPNRAPRRTRRRTLTGRRLLISDLIGHRAGPRSDWVVAETSSPRNAPRSAVRRYRPGSEAWCDMCASCHHFGDGRVPFDRCASCDRARICRRRPVRARHACGRQGSQNAGLNRVWIGRTGGRWIPALSADCSGDRADGAHRSGSCGRPQRDTHHRPWAQENQAVRSVRARCADRH